MRCVVFMFSLSQADRSTICVLEEKLKDAVEEFINVDPLDRWTVEDLISKYSRKEPVTAEDVTLGYVLLSLPEKVVDLSVTKDANKEIIEAIMQSANQAGFRVESQQ